MRYLPICVLLAMMCLPMVSIWLLVSILCIATFWMLVCVTQPTTPVISVSNVSHVIDPFAEFMGDSDGEGPFNSNNPPNADGGDFDYE